MEQSDYYAFLDELRESGQTNMFGAGAVLQEVFGLSKYEAKDIVLAWMQQYGKPNG